MMTHAEEFEEFVGGHQSEDENGLCLRCNDWPCHCVADQLAEDDPLRG